MNFHRLRRPLVVWLALLVAVFGALAPTLSRAMNGAHASTQAMVEICSASGSHWVSVDTEPGSHDGPKSVTLFEHCPLCPHAADRALPPPRSSFQAFGILGEPAPPTILQAFLFIRLSVHVPPSRGPPV